MRSALLDLYCHT